MALSTKRARVLEQMHVRYPSMYRGLRVVWRAVRKHFRDYPRYRAKLLRLATPAAMEAELQVHLICPLDDRTTAREIRRLRRSLRNQGDALVRIHWLGDTNALAEAGSLPEGEGRLGADRNQWQGLLGAFGPDSPDSQMVLLCRPGVRFLTGALAQLHQALRARSENRVVFADHEYLQQGRLRLAAKGVFDRRLADVYAEREPCLALDPDWWATQVAAGVQVEHFTSLIASMLAATDETAVAHLPLPVARVERDMGATGPALDGTTLPEAGSNGGEHGTRSLPSPARIAVIIPTRDGMPQLPLAVESALAAMAESGCSGRVVIIDNGSEQVDTRDYLHAIDTTERDGVRVDVRRYDYPFNYAAMHNWAVAGLEEEYLLLLNDDVEALAANGSAWLGRLICHMADARVGAVGAQLRYPNGALQHAGVVLGLGIDHIAGHVGVGLEPGDERLTEAGLGRPRAVSAVTAACMLTRRALFESLGGFEAIGLPVAFNDVDYCLRLREAGYDVVMEPRAVLLHHESLSRGQDHDPAKRARFESECAFMKSRWGDALAEDPYYSPHYSNETADLSLRAAPEPPAIRPRHATRPVAHR